MKLYKLFLLIVLGALSAMIGCAFYAGIILWRYPSLKSQTDAITPGIWGILIGIPVGIGIITGLFFPLWQRSVSINNKLARSILLWIVTMTAVVVAGFGWLSFKTGRPLAVFTRLLSLDFAFWIVCAIAAGIVFHLLRVLSGETHEAEAVVGKKLRQTIGFKPQETQTMHGIALICDLQGFSAFFNQPWAQAYVPDYLDLVLNAVSIVLLGGRKFWGDEEVLKPLLRPVHQKFLGDGVLYLWTPPVGKADFDEDFVAELTNRLWYLKNEFPAINRTSAGQIPSSFKLPSKLRFGLARGKIYELTRKDSPEKEYMGFCINLASRLQSYCHDLGFIASATLGIPQATLERTGFIEVQATKIKGFEREAVIVDKCEYESLDAGIKAKLFEKA